MMRMEPVMYDSYKEFRSMLDEFMQDYEEILMDRAQSRDFVRGKTLELLLLLTKGSNKRMCKRVNRSISFLMDEPYSEIQIVRRIPDSGVIRRMSSIYIFHEWAHELHQLIERTSFQGAKKTMPVWKARVFMGMRALPLDVKLLIVGG